MLLFVETQHPNHLSLIIINLNLPFEHILEVSGCPELSVSLSACSGAECSERSLGPGLGDLPPLRMPSAGPPPPPPLSMSVIMNLDRVAAVCGMARASSCTVMPATVGPVSPTPNTLSDKSPRSSSVFNAGNHRLPRACCENFDSCAHDRRKEEVFLLKSQSETVENVPKSRNHQVWCSWREDLAFHALRTQSQNQVWCEEIASHTQNPQGTSLFPLQTQSKSDDENRPKFRATLLYYHHKLSSTAK